MQKKPPTRTLLLTVFLLVFNSGASAREKIVVIPLSDDTGDAAYLWLPAADAVVRYGDSTQGHAEAESYGRTCVEQDVGGSLLVDVFFPIQISVPDRRHRRIESASIFYTAPAANAFINRTQVQGRNFSTGASVTLASDGTQRTSATFDGYTIPITDHEAVTAIVTPTNVALQLRMTAIGSTVCLYGVRLQFE